MSRCCSNPLRHYLNPVSLKKFTRDLHCLQKPEGWIMAGTLCFTVLAVLLGVSDESQKCALIFV